MLNELELANTIYCVSKTVKTETDRRIIAQLNQLRERLEALLAATIQAKLIDECEHLDYADTLDSYVCQACGYEEEVGDTQFYYEARSDVTY